MKEEEMYYLKIFYELHEVESILIDLRTQFLGLDAKEVEDVRKKVTEWRSVVRKKFTIE